MKKQTFIAIMVSVFAVLTANLGYIYGVFVDMPGMYFLGRRVINSLDAATYMSFIEQAKQGRWILANQYSTENLDPTLIRPLYTILGKIAEILNISSRDIYLASIIILGFVFCIVLYKFLGNFFEDSWRKVFVFSVILTSTGFGYLMGNIFPESIDLWIPEANTFLSLGEAPHFIFSQILMLLAFIFFMKGFEKNHPKSFLLSGIFLLILVFEHPFNIFVTFCVMAVLTVVFERRKMVKQSLVPWVISVFLIQIVGILYHYQSIFSNDVISQWYQANLLPSPPPINFIVGYGLLIPFALIGLEKFVSRQTPYRLLTIAWLIVTIILLYSPLSFQRRVSEGVHIPLGILAGVGVLTVARFISSYCLESIRIGVFRSFNILIVIFLSIGSIASSVKDVRAIKGDNYDNYFYHIRNSEKEALDILRENTSFEDVILANISYGNFIPGITGRPVYLGHAIQTHNLQGKINIANSFLLEENHDQAILFLKENRIKFIFLGPNDQMLVYGFKPEEKPYLELAYQNNGISIYHVIDPALNSGRNQELPLQTSEDEYINLGENPANGENAQDINIFIPAEPNSSEE